MINQNLIWTFCFSILVSCKESNEQLLDKAYLLSKENKYAEAIKVYTEVLNRNKKVQLAYYNRGICYSNIKEYSRAMEDFNRVMSFNSSPNGDIVFVLSDNPVFQGTGEDTKVSYYDALYQRAQVNFFMDSINDSFKDFQTLINANYQRKCNCLLWQGTIWIKAGNKIKGCEFFNEANTFAVTEDDLNQTKEMIKTYCEK